MKRFSDLYRAIDESTKTNDKILAMVDYFRTVSAEDASWAIYFLSGNRLKTKLATKVLRSWATTRRCIPEWLFEEAYHWVGDLAETISLIVPARNEETIGSLSEWATSELMSIRNSSLDETYSDLDQLWERIGRDDRFMVLKLLTGSMRVGVSRKSVIRSIADAFELPVETVAHRMMGTWVPNTKSFYDLIDANNVATHAAHPYPFCLANPLEASAESLGEVDDYVAEWKWDGIRCQLIRREGATYLWSRGEERMEDRFPEIMLAAEGLPSECVLDGELLGWRDGRPLTFAEMQRRINRKTIGKKLLSEVPVSFLVFDLLEWKGEDLRNEPLRTRRELLTSFVSPSQPISSVDTVEQALDKPVAVNSEPTIRVSPRVIGASWHELEAMRSTCRTFGCEGLMLKQLESRYESGRTRGAWWKWKIEPYSVDAVLIYAQRGHGRRANLYSDYTFAVWDDDQLVPFAKAYSGLTDDEMKKVDKFIRANTKEKFGPVRSVTPEIVMEISFENIQISTRHKSGIAVRFPRITRWRTDKKPIDANSLDDVRRMIRANTQHSSTV